ncbi:MAG TPA: hypothetical protein PK325_09835 [Cyclobacteriaceae bacterium]|nr:hypothetical protein [Cyclobacteriaceae bacterium]HMV09527.1 hypothetical protein [Cyclobacteriaceae bacterium]HMX02010.1 hypothetical protein [Cyclobacteriaceae bacterium]HMX51879.1 hypothetical protein [Cyclobacteriaceae bacterium]HMY94833.1 hypothetical protein [Cyclobacteriaceae bacterium]
MSVLLGMFGCDRKSIEQKFNAKPTFEEQLETFKHLGFILNPGIDTADITRWAGGHKEFEDHPYQLMYQALGSINELEPWISLTNRCWDFDLEAIEDHGAYVYIMENISRITNGDLVFKDIQDYVDIEEGKAWVSFTCNGDNYKWDLRVDDDWTDGELFDKVQALAQKYKTNGKFTFFNTGGQDFVLGYHTPEELEKIRKATGLDIVWLKAEGQIY